MSKITGKPTKLPDEVAQILAMRAAGWTHAAIAQKVDLSVRQVQRHVKDHKVEKGIINQTLIEEARSALMESVTNDSTIKTLIATQLHDDISHVRLLRDRAALVMDGLIPTTLEESALAMRALAAHSTVLKNTSDILHRYTRKSIDDLGETTKIRPEITIRVIDDAEARRLVEESASRVKTFGVDLDVDDDPPAS